MRILLKQVKNRQINNFNLLQTTPARRQEDKRRKRREIKRVFFELSQNRLNRRFLLQKFRRKLLLINQKLQRKMLKRS